MKRKATQVPRQVRQGDVLVEETTMAVRLRCHPELRPIKNGQVVGEPQAMRARNAVAASFGRRGENYAPVEQT